MIKNFFEANQIIGDKLQSGEPFSCLRIDNTSGYILNCFYKNTFPSSEFFNDRIMIEAGVVPATTEYFFSTIMPKTFDLVKQCDILGFVDVGGEIAKDSNFLSNFKNKPIFCDHYVMDPGALLGYKSEYQLDNPWTQYLAGKKVLVISSHSASIKHQWSHMDSVWGDKKNKIVPFELVDAISTPYHPDLDDRQYMNCSDFMDKIEITKNIIDEYDYDVLLTGVTCQSPFYAQHAKDNGKVGIQTGGTIQLFFGIVGNRWVHVPPPSPGVPKWNEMFNENWIWPMQVDEPQRKNKIDGSEAGFAYWR